MYCLQWLLPVLLMPLPKTGLAFVNIGLLHSHAMFIILYLTSFFLERRPCTICTLVFAVALGLICYNCLGNCVFFCCNESGSCEAMENL